MIGPAATAAAAAEAAAAPVWTQTPSRPQWFSSARSEEFVAPLASPDVKLIASLPCVKETHLRVDNVFGNRPGIWIIEYLR